LSASAALACEFEDAVTLGLGLRIPGEVARESAMMSPSIPIGFVTATYRARIESQGSSCVMPLRVGPLRHRSR
jgi:hypothetical protein